MRLSALFLLVSLTAALAELQEIPNFSLLDYRGKYHELRRADGRAVVLFFTANGCPHARQSVPKLRAARSKFASQGVVFWMVNSNPQDDRKSIAEEVEKFRIGSIPILKDDVQALARLLKVQSTCETFAIDTAGMKIFYRGALDEQLPNALTAFLAGKTVEVAPNAVKGSPIKCEKSEPISYATQVVPILQAKCVSCHSPGNIGPWSMASYKKVKGMSAMIQETILAKQMPPWHADPLHGTFSNNRSLSAEETRTLLAWIEQGAPQGEGLDPLTNSVPPLREWAPGKPDLIVSLPGTQEIPAAGVLDYRYVDSGFAMAEDAWVRAAVVRPGNRKVVHHVIVRIKYPSGAKGAPEEEVFFTSWAPGNTTPEFPRETGKFIPKGATFNFELHYNTTGKPETDQSELGLYLLKDTPRMVLETRTTETRDLNIPPGEADTRSFCVYHFKRDTLLFDLVPHMHLRGSWFKYEVLFPDGKRETLLSVPRYDFNWQTEYRLAEPRKVPAGTWILCSGAHDNSKQNPYNPDATRRVKYGLQSYEEMFMGFMNVAEVR
jgi:peroxiredoxin